MSNTDGDLSMDSKAERAIDLTDPENVSSITCDATDASSSCIEALETEEDKDIYGNYGFWWSADHPPTEMWWQVELTDPKQFKQVRFGLAPLCSYRRLVASNDGINYSTIIPRTVKYLQPTNTVDLSSFPEYKYYKFEAGDTNSGWDEGWQCPTEPPLIFYGLEFLKSSQATHTSASTQLDAGVHTNLNWTTFVPSATIPANTSINFRFRTSADAATWGSWTASTAYAGSIDLATLFGNTDKAKRYLQVETTLANTDGTSTPVLDAYTANFTNYILDHVTISPTPVTLYTGGAQAFTAVAYDDSNNVISGAVFGWSATCGSVNSLGNYTAPASIGTCYVTAETTIDGVTKSATATVNVIAPPITPPTCTDGAQNGDETGVDCGGSCPVCPPPPYCVGDICFCTRDNCIGVVTEVEVLLPDGSESYHAGDTIPITFLVSNENLYPFYRQNLPVIKTPFLTLDAYYSRNADGNYQKIINDIDYSSNLGFLLGNHNQVWLKVKADWIAPTDGSLNSFGSKVLVRAHTRSGDSPTTFYTQAKKVSAIFVAWDILNANFEVINPPPPPPCVGADCKCVGDSCWCVGANCSCTDPDKCKPCVGADCDCASDTCHCTGADCDCSDPKTCQKCVGADCQPCSGDECLPDCSGNDCVIIPPICIGSFCIEFPALIADKISTIFLALTAILALLALLFSIGSNILSMIRPSELLAFLLKGKERKHALGITYDSATGLPIPLTKVLLFRARDSKLLKVAISDKNGRFALETAPGEEYFIDVKKEGYKILSGAGANLLKNELAYEDNYFGQKFTTSDARPIFDRPIPLQQTLESLNLVLGVKVFESVAKFLRLINVPITLLGFVFSIIALQNSPTIYNKTIFAIYVLILIYFAYNLFVRSGRNRGLVFNKESRKPVDLAIVRAISETSGRLVRTTVSNEKGRYTLTLPKGFYEIIVAKAELKQDTAIRLRVRSNFALERAKIGMNRISTTSKTTLQRAEKQAKAWTPSIRRTALDSKEIIERFLEKKEKYGTSDINDGGVKHLINDKDISELPSDSGQKTNLSKENSKTIAKIPPNWQLPKTNPPL